MTVLEEATQHAKALRASGQLDAALKAYAQVLAQDKTRDEVCVAMGHVLCDLGRPQEAVVMFRRAQTLNPTSGKPYNGLGRALRQLNQFEDAFTQFKEALRREPDLMSAYVDMGQLLIRFGQLAGAQTCFESGLEINPQYGPLYEGLGLVAMRQNEPIQAIPYYQKALELGPITAGLLSNAANALMAVDRYTEALKYLDEAVQKAPNLAVAHYNRGVCLTRLNHIEAAVGAYDHAVTLQPQNAGAQFNRALLWLKQGDYTRGFEGYHWRFRFDPSYQDEVFRQPPWQGEPLAGQTILVMAEQGMGDTLQFARFLPMLQAQGARVILTVQPSILSLFEAFPGADEVRPKPAVSGPTPMDEGMDYDVYTYLMSLPTLLGTTLETLPHPSEFPNLPLETLEAWKTRLGENPRLKIGFVWASKADNPTSAWRSCPVAHFLSLAQACPNVDFYSLQKGPAESDLAQGQLPHNVTDLSQDLGDFIQTATAILQLDVILTVDTAVAHLAASLGKPVWLLLPYWSDWRWLQSGEDSPWYPSVRVFRSTALGDWASVFGQVQALIQ